MFYNILYGLLMFAGGVLILKFRKNVLDWTGWWWWAEHYLGRGGTVVALCLIGCGMMGFGVATMFGKVNFSNRSNTEIAWTQTNQTDDTNSSTNNR